MQKSKMAVWGGLTNSCEKKRSEKQRRKGKHLNAEFQRIARRDKLANYTFDIVGKQYHQLYMSLL